MLIFEELNKKIIYSLYASKAKILNLSPALLNGADDNMNLKTIVKFSETKEILDKQIKTILINPESNFLDFSLIMGLFFGVYNQYQYEYIDFEIKSKIVKNAPNCEQIKETVEHNKNKIFEFLVKYYKIDRKTFEDTISRMFILEDENSEYSLYEEGFANIIGKIILGNYLYLNELGIKNSTYLIDCEDAIKFIDKLNQKSIKLF